MRRFIGAVLILGVCLAFAGCPQNNQVLLPPPGSVSVSHVYVGQNSAGISPFMLLFLIPVSNSSTPTATLAPPGVNARATSIAFDSSNHMYVASFSDSLVYVYNPPITSASTAAFSFAANHAEGVAFDGSGRLFVSGETTGNIFVFTPPFTSGSTPSLTMTGAGGPRQGVFDSSGNFIVSGCAAVGHQLNAFTPPFTNSETPSVHFDVAGANCISGVAVNPVTHQLFATDLGTNNIYVFNLPLNNSSTPALTITGTNSGEAWSIAFDAQQNLYAADFGRNKLDIYAPPFSASSSPAVNIALGFEPSGLALGL